MARIIKSKKRRRRGARKSTRSAARSVVVRTKKIYRRAKGINVSTKDVIISVAAGGAGAIASTVVAEKLPIANETVKAAAIAAAGGFLTYKGVKKKNMAVTGLGMGMAAAGAATMIKKFVPGVSTVGAPFVNPMLAAPMRRRTVGAPYVNPRTLSGCRSVPDEDYV